MILKGIRKFLIRSYKKNLGFKYFCIEIREELFIFVNYLVGVMC